MCSPRKSNENFSIFTFLWIKTNVAYTRLEMIARTKYCTTTTASNWFVTLYYKLLPAVRSPSKHGRWRSSLLLYSISMAFTAKSGRKHYNPPPLTVMWMNFDSPYFPSLCSLSAIILFQTCSNKCILYVLSFHKCIKIKYKTVNMYGVFLWLVQSSSRWNTIHSHRNYHVQLLSVRVGEFCHPARSR